MNETFKFLKENTQVNYLATVKGDKPTFKSLEIIYNCECNLGIKSKSILSLTNLGQSLLDICLSK